MRIEVEPQGNRHGQGRNSAQTVTSSSTQKDHIHFTREQYIIIACVKITSEINECVKSTCEKCEVFKNHIKCQFHM